MITKQSLEKQLEDLRNKWKGDYPKSYMDKRWWKFKTDKCLAEQIKENIKKIDAGIEVIDYDEVEKLFNS
jgi:hypothetical protein